MILFTILLLFGCSLLFISGAIAGFVLCKQRSSTIVEDNMPSSETNAAIGKTFTDTGVNHDTHISEYRALRDAFDQLQKKLSDRDLEFQQLVATSAADKKIIGDYERTIAEYTGKQQHLDEYEQKNSALSMLIAQQTKQLSELETIKSQADRFEEVTKFARELETQNGYLQEEIAKLKKAGEKTVPFIKMAGFKTISSTNSIKEVCKKILESTGSYRNNRGAAISDDLGFAIVASDEYADELAALSVVHNYCEKILNSTIPFGNITKITIKNANDLILTVIPFIINGQMVFYSGLSLGHREIGSPAGKIAHALVIK